MKWICSTDHQQEPGELILTLHWKGGVHTQLRLPRPRLGQSSTQTPRELIEAITVLAAFPAMM
jgi:hypothetical protein